MELVESKAQDQARKVDMVSEEITKLKTQRKQLVKDKGNLGPDDYTEYFKSNCAPSFAGREYEAKHPKGIPVVKIFESKVSEFLMEKGLKLKIFTPTVKEVFDRLNGENNGVFFSSMVGQSYEKILKVASEKIVNTVVRAKGGKPFQVYIDYMIWKIVFSLLTIWHYFNMLYSVAMSSENEICFSFIDHLQAAITNLFIVSLLTYSCLQLRTEPAHLNTNFKPPPYFAYLKNGFTMFLSKFFVQLYLHYDAGGALNTFAFDWVGCKIGIMVVCLYVTPVYDLFFTHIPKYWTSVHEIAEERNKKITKLLAVFNPFFNIALMIFANWCLNVYFNPTNVNGVHFGLWSPSTGGVVSLGQAFKEGFYVMYRKPIAVGGYIIPCLSGQLLSWIFWIPVWYLELHISIASFIWNIIFDLLVLAP